MARIKGWFIDPEYDRCGMAMVDNSLNSLYRLLHCDMIEVAPVYIGGVKMLVICDEEALIKRDKLPLPSVVYVTSRGRYCSHIHGAALIVAGTDEEGEFCGLDEKGAELVRENIVEMYDVSEGRRVHRAVRMDD